MIFREISRVLVTVSFKNKFDDTTACFMFIVSREKESGGFSFLFIISPVRIGIECVAQNAVYFYGSS